MIRFRAPHPGEEQLLRFADGELRPKEAAHVRAHLEACWGCRTQLEDLERSIGDYVRYHEGVLKPHLPEPPRPWADLRGQMERLDQARETAPSAPRAWLRVPPRWLSAAAVLVVVFLAVYRFGRLPAVNAAELLERAAAASQPATKEHRQIRVRTRTRSFTRPAWYHAAAGTNSDSIETLFAAARYSWEDPLSARSYTAWRNQLPSKHDEVDTARGVYRIRTTTDHGTLAEATLTLRTQDLSPVSGTFQFRGSEWVEITEVPGEPAAPSLAGPAVARERSEAGIPEPAPRIERPEVDAPASPELQVIAALHQIGADLGDPIELTRNGRQVVVVGTGIEPERQEEVRSSLARLQGVTLRFDDPKPAIPEGSTPAAAAPVAAPRTPFAPAIEKAVGGRVAFEKFANQVLDLSEAAMARAHALRNLAERFPAPAESQLTEKDKSLLATLRREHAQVLAGTAAEIGDLLRPVLKGEAARTSVVTAASWQAGAEQVLASAQQVDQLLNVLLAGADARSSPDEITARLNTALQRFKARTAAYRDALTEGTR
jgi:hypothetical protein